MKCPCFCSAASSSSLAAAAAAAEMPVEVAAAAVQPSRLCSRHLRQSSEEGNVLQPRALTRGGDRLSPKSSEQSDLLRHRGDLQGLSTRRVVRFLDEQQAQWEFPTDAPFPTRRDPKRERSGSRQLQRQLLHRRRYYHTVIAKAFGPYFGISEWHCGAGRCVNLKIAQLCIVRRPRRLRTRVCDVVHSHCPLFLDSLRLVLGAFTALARCKEPHGTLPLLEFWTDGGTNLGFNPGGHCTNNSFNRRSQVSTNIVFWGYTCTNPHNYGLWFSSRTSPRLTFIFWCYSLQYLRSESEAL